MRQGKAPTAAFAPATADTSPLEASQRSALSRAGAGYGGNDHIVRAHTAAETEQRTAARAVHVYPANNRGGAARRRGVIGTTWPRRRRKSAAARMTGAPLGAKRRGHEDEGEGAMFTAAEHGHRRLALHQSEWGSALGANTGAGGYGVRR